VADIEQIPVVASRRRQGNEAFDIVVGARALAWGEGAGQLTGSEWRERAAKAHRAGEQPSLFSAPMVAPGMHAETPSPATPHNEIELVVAAAAKLKAAAEAGGERRILWQTRTKT
jgi:phage terminase large subunit GpA-like protein